MEPLSNTRPITVNGEYTVFTSSAEVYSFFVQGTFDGASVSLQWSNDGGNNWEDYGGDATIIETSGRKHTQVNGRNHMRVLVSSGGSSMELYVSVDLVNGAVSNSVEVSNDIATAIPVQTQDLEHTIDDTAIAVLPLNSLNYSDSTYSYECFAFSGNEPSSSIWRVKRTENSTGNVLWAGGLPFTSPNYGYENPATDLATVQGLTYNYDSDAGAYFNAAELVDPAAYDLTATNPTYTAGYTKEGHNALFRALKGQSSIFDSGYGTKPTASNVWSKIDELYFLAGVGSLSGMTVKAKGTGILTFNNFVAGDLNPLEGLTGDGSTKNIDLAILNSDIPEGDSHIGVSVFADGVGTGEQYFVGSDSGAVNRLSLQFANSETRIRYVDDDGFLSVTVVAAPAPRYILGTKNGDLSKIFIDNSEVGSGTQNSPRIPHDTELSAFSNNRGPSSPGYRDFSDATISTIHIGRGLSDAEVQYLKWCINSHATYFGFNTYTNP